MRWRQIHWHSLKTRISLATFGIFLVGLWSLSFYISQVLHSDLEKLLGEQQFSTVTMLASQIDRELETRYSALDNVAQIAAPLMQDEERANLQSLIGDIPALRALFNGGIVLHDHAGRVTVKFPVPPAQNDAKHDDGDRKPSAYVDEVFKTKRRAIDGPFVPYLHGATGSGSLGKVIMAVPIRRSQPMNGAVGQEAGEDGRGEESQEAGEIIGVLAGVIDLAAANFLSSATGSRHGVTGEYFLISPGHRLIVSATNQARVMETLGGSGVNPAQDRFLNGYEGTAVFTSSGGVHVLASARGIPSVGWIVAANLPAAEAFEPIRDVNRRLRLAALVLTVLAAGLIWWILRRQLSSLESTVETLAAMSDERLPLRALPVVREDEIGRLIGSFNHMIAAIGQREVELNQILDTSSVAIFLIDMNGCITRANRRMAQMFGCSAHDSLIGQEYVALVHPEEREIGRQKMLALLHSEVASVELDRRYWRTDKTEFWGRLTGQRFYDASGIERGLVGVIADITGRKAAEEKLKLAASVFTHAREGVAITATDGTIIDVNDSFTRITGYARDEVLGKNPRVLKSDHHPAEFYTDLWRHLLDSGFWHGEVWNRRKNGELYAEILTISAVRDEQGVAQHYVALFTDITPMKEHERQLERMAHYDVLTTLPNRVLLADRLHQAMVHAARQRRHIAVAYVDLDGFKAVNDTYGHQTGDQLLIAIAGRMKTSLRQGDTLARLGGDEFVAVLLDLNDIAASEPILSRLLESAAQPVHIGELVLQVSASLGVSFFPQTDEVDADQLLRQADQAMYQAKLAGKNRFHFFDAAQDRSMRGHHESLQRIGQALANREFVLYYQPKVNMRTGELVGAEALIRWQHPEQGLLPPLAFLPKIENHALAVELGEWVIETALVQIEHWGAAGLHLPVSVNVGARQLQQAGFAERLQGILSRHPSFQPGDLSIEVLETSALEYLINVSSIMRSCRELGVSFALDDFGTGYSSLTYLKRLPVSLLKIDQSFVRGMLDDPDDLTILEGVISLSGAFRRAVIAEGVETVEHGEMLLQLGCELAQGYGIARPMPAEKLLGWARHWAPDDRWQNLVPVNRDDLPLLFASVEHRAWIAGMTGYLKNQRPLPMPLDSQQCRFGAWLDSEGRARYADQVSYQRVETLHEQVHALARELCALHAGGQHTMLEGRLGELDVLSSVLLARLQALLREQS